MTGWRLGWLVARRDLAQKATELNEFIVSHAPAMAQKAGENALREGEPEIREMISRLRDQRGFCIRALSSIKRVTLPKPEGAFYLFPRIEGLTDSFGFCHLLLLEKRVGLAPGVAFGAGGEGSVRICYAADRSILEPAMERLARFLENPNKNYGKTLVATVSRLRLGFNPRAESYGAATLDKIRL